jgi:hypothetical protein
MTTYQERLDGARKAVAAIRASGGKLPADVEDQLAAATRDTKGLFDEFEQAVTLIDPGRDWRSSRSPIRSARFDEVTARTLATIATFRLCLHHRRTPAQPCIARLAVRRLDCRRCTATMVRPPDGEDDRCDWCGRRGVATFWPVTYTSGTMLVCGDACRDCAAELSPEAVR